MVIWPQPAVKTAQQWGFRRHAGEIDIELYTTLIDVQQVVVPTSTACSQAYGEGMSTR